MMLKISHVYCTKHRHVLRQAEARFSSGALLTSEHQFIGEFAEVRSVDRYLDRPVIEVIL